MRSIGGEFDFAPPVPLRGWEDTPRQPASGRGALFQILRHIQHPRPVATEVALPDYVCGSVIDAVASAGLTPRFYRVREDLRADRESLVRALSTSPTSLLLISYFGLIDLTEDIAFARGVSPAVVIIKDDVHSPFDAANLRGADYVFTSLRKSFPVVDGAPITPSIPLSLDDAPAAPFALAKLAGGIAKHSQQSERTRDEAYLALLREGEARLDDGSSYRAAMSWMSESLLASVDRAAVRERRRENFSTLQAAVEPLGLRPMVPLSREAVPLFLPVVLPNRDAVRAELARQRIYCPAHWPIPAGHAPGEEHFYDRELSLVVDQRYDADDMHRLARGLEEALVTTRSNPRR